MSFLRLLGRLIKKSQFQKPFPPFTNYREIRNAWGTTTTTYHDKILFLMMPFFRDDSDESSVPHPDPAVRGGQVSRGGERDAAVRDERDQRQEEADPAPHWVRGVRGAARHDQAHPAICPRARE